MKQEEEKSVGLPDNAFRPLKPGEQYHPIMSPNKKYPEVNLWSVLWGIAMAVLFSAAAAYLGLKVGTRFLKPPSLSAIYRRRCIGSRQA